MYKIYYFCLGLVEARGVEPLSENPTTRASPSAVGVLTFPLPGSRQQDTGFSSFINSGLSQSFDRFVPRLNGAGYLCRGRLRADVRCIKQRKQIRYYLQLFFFPIDEAARDPPLASRIIQGPRRNQIRPRIWHGVGISDSAPASCGRSRV